MSKHDVYPKGPSEEMNAGVVVLGKNQEEFSQSLGGCGD
jgi:hypothetical protein